VAGPGVARGRLLVDFDRRGTGSSQRDVDDLSPEAHRRNLEAVTDHLNFERLHLLGRYDGGAVAAEYAAEHPERVAKLILCAAAVRGDQTAAGRMRDKLTDLIRSDWSLARRALATAAAEYSTAEELRRYSRSIRESITPEMAIRYLAYIADVDISGVLSRVAAPTLVVNPRDDQNVTLEAGREVAVLIPNARFVVLEDRSVSTETAVLNRFLDDVTEQPSAPAFPQGTAIILFADIADSTALTEKLGDAAFREKARELDVALRDAIASNGGTAIKGKLLGDGVLATFGAAREAIACAQAMHDAGSYAGLPLHVGIHAGDVIRDANNVYGGAVNIAARVASEAAAGETLVSGTVRELAAGEGFLFADIGEVVPKGFEEPVRLYEVRWREEP